MASPDGPAPTMTGPLTHTHLLPKKLSCCEKLNILVNFYETQANKFPKEIDEIFVLFKVFIGVES